MLLFKPGSKFISEPSSAPSLPFVCYYALSSTHRSGAEEKTQHKLVLLVDAIWMGWREDSRDPPGALPRLMPARRAQTAASPAAGRGNTAGPDMPFPLHCDFTKDHGCCGLCLQPKNSNSFHLSACSPNCAEAPGGVPGR